MGARAGGGMTIPFATFFASKAGKIVGAVLLAAISLGVILAWFARHDAKVIDRHETKRELGQARRSITAEREANAKAEIREADAKRNQGELNDVQRSAETMDPEGARGPVGPATRAVTDELRRQRGAGSP